LSANGNTKSFNVGKTKLLMMARHCEATKGYTTIYTRRRNQWLVSY